MAYNTQNLELQLYKAEDGREIETGEKKMTQQYKNRK